MKKNLLTILILAFQVVQVIILGFILLSVMSTNSKTVAFVNDIAAAYELEQAGGLGGGVDPASVNTNVALGDRATYNVNNGETMTFTLNAGSDGRTHYAQVTLELVMDATNPDYATYSGMIAANDNTIQDIVQNVFVKYNIDNVMDSQELIKQEILQQLWSMFDNTTFIFLLNMRVTPA
ncbi:MAG: flagellar basal body-associated FliL family protein [Lachnospiraceae bacterium]|nr:flagellar basal body-associated FliL family protein [Lachnospiraceae bacterium]